MDSQPPPRQAPPPAAGALPVRSGFLASFRGVVAVDAPVVILCLVLIGFGVFLRGYRLGYPGHTTFDEDHFVINARNYIDGNPDGNDHPPLGKLLVAASVLALGDYGVGWRAMPFLLGLGNIALAFLLGRRMWPADRRAAWLAAAFVASDGLFAVYARTALLDGMLAFFFLASVLAFVRARRPWQIAVGALLAGLATSIKFTGVVLVLPLLATCWFQRRHLPWWAITTTLLFPLGYFAVYALGLWITGKPAGVQGVIHASTNLLALHKKANAGIHPSSSPWYSWAVPTHPITLRHFATPQGRVRGLVTLGNPVLWWGALVALAAAVVQAAVFTFHKWRRQPTGIDSDRVAIKGWLFALWILPIVPWIISDRDSYLYHYLPAYGFALILLAGEVSQIRQRYRIIGLCLLVVLVWVTALFAPFWAQLEITHVAWRQRLFLPWWY